VTLGSEDRVPSPTERGVQAAAALAETWGSLAGVCVGLTAQQWRRSTSCPGWSVQDQLSHLIGIERTLLGEPDPQWDAPLGEHVKTPFAQSNEKWVAARRAWPGEEVLAEFVEVTKVRLARLGELDDDGWAHVAPTVIGDVPYAEFMRTRAFDSWVHEQDVRVALGRPGGGGNLASEIALSQVQAAMGFVVGKKAAAPEGTVVRFSVYGPSRDARQFSIGVEAGRARPVPGDRVPTVTLNLSALDFVLLGCGRVTAEAVEAGGLTMEGDQKVGNRVLDAMNFMF
jgi:uncharacterized protein (TIGR03083 family)